jgi:hypothetical protein
MANDDLPIEVFARPFSFSVCITIAVDDRVSATAIIKVVSRPRHYY